MQEMAKEILDITLIMVQYWSFFLIFAFIFVVDLKDNGLNSTNKNISQYCSEDFHWKKRGDDLFQSLKFSALTSPAFLIFQ